MPVSSLSTTLVKFPISRSSSVETSSPSRRSSKSVSRSETPRGYVPVALDGFLETLAVLHDLLALFGGIPKIGGADLIFGLLKLIAFRGRVKDSSARLQLADGA